MSEIDFFALEEEARQDIDETEPVKRLSLMAEKQVKLEKTLDQLERTRKELAGQLRKLSEDLIPTQMKELGYNSFELVDGSSIKIKDMVFANISGEREEEAHKWLRDNNHGSIIKHVIEMKFGMGEDDKAAQLKATLDESGQQYGEKESVHAGTLKAWARKELEAGRADDDFRKLFGVHEAKVTKITR